MQVVAATVVDHGAGCLISLQQDPLCKGSLKTWKTMAKERLSTVNTNANKETSLPEFKFGWQAFF